MGNGGRLELDLILNSFTMRAHRPGMRNAVKNPEAT